MQAHHDDRDLQLGDSVKKYSCAPGQKPRLSRQGQRKQWKTKDEKHRREENAAPLPGLLGRWRPSSIIVPAINMNRVETSGCTQGAQTMIEDLRARRQSVTSCVGRSRPF
jgi:hypothetical protein